MERLFGRQAIYTDVDEITAANVLDVISKTKDAFEKNYAQIDFLYKYYRGDQPILTRKKEVRPEICNRIVENRANEIVSFKVGYLCGEPIQYISRSGEDGVGQGVSRLNDMMLVESKSAKDKDLIEWQMIAGTAFRMVLVSDDSSGSESPFELYTLDPRCAYVVYSSKIGNKPMAGVHIGTNADGETIYSVYTKNEFFEVNGREVLSTRNHGLGWIPIIEYPANNARLGSFETVIPVLNAINTVASNRIDGVEQFVQSLMKFTNCEIDKETFATLQQMGAISIKSQDGKTADVEILTQELNQQQTQTLVDYMYQTVLTICGMPNRNGGGSSTSDTGAASLLRDGWTMAEARAKDSELMFKRSEREMLKIVLRICSLTTDVSLKLSDIETKFTRRNYENIQTKAQVLCEMLNNPKIDPKLAFYACGMFTDSEDAYQMSMEYYNDMQKKLTEQQLNSGGGSLSGQQTEKS